MEENSLSPPPPRPLPRFEPQSQGSLICLAEPLTYLPAWRHLWASRYFTSDGELWPKKAVTCGEQTSSSGWIRQSGRTDSAAASCAGPSRAFGRERGETGKDGWVQSLTCQSGEFHFYASSPASQTTDLLRSKVLQDARF